MLTKLFSFFSKNKKNDNGVLKEKVELKKVPMETIREVKVEHKTSEKPIVEVSPTEAYTSAFINNPYGIHARPSSMIVKYSSSYNGEITFKKPKNKDVTNADNIISVMSMGLVKGDEVEIYVKGDDARATCEKMKALIESFDYDR